LIFLQALSKTWRVPIAEKKGTFVRLSFANYRKSITRDCREYRAVAVVSLWNFCGL